MAKVKGWKDKNYIKANILYYASLEEISCLKLAKAVGVAESTFLKYLNEPETMKVGVLQKLAELFSCKVTDLVIEKRIA